MKFLRGYFLITGVFQIFGYFLVISDYLGYVRSEVFCSGEIARTRWDLSMYSDIAYVYIKQEGDLIAVITNPNNIEIEDPYRNLTQINVSEKWLVEMTMYNVTYATNGTYNCTIGILGKQDSILPKEISVIDPEITISMNTTDKKCKNVICASKFNVTLIGPNNRKIESGTCLSEDDNGNYSCCLSDKSMCHSKRCESKDVRMEDHTNKFHSRNEEYTTMEISTSTQVDQQNANIVVYIIIAVAVLLVFASIVVSIIFRKKLPKCIPDFSCINMWNQEKDPVGQGENLELCQLEKEIKE